MKEDMDNTSNNDLNQLKENLSNIGYEIDNQEYKIDDIEIKQLSYGFHVRVGDCSLGVENQDNLQILFREYLNNPVRTKKLFNQGKLQNLYNEGQAQRLAEIQRKLAAVADKQEAVIAVVGYSQEEIKNSINNWFIPVVIRNGEYHVETMESLITYVPITKLEHVRGREFMRIVETPRARENRDFEKIMNFISQTQ